VFEGESFENFNNARKARQSYELPCDRVRGRTGRFMAAAAVNGLTGLTPAYDRFPFRSVGVLRIEN
jgi:hypothetical protein